MGGTSIGQLVVFPSHPSTMRFPTTYLPALAIALFSGLVGCSPKQNPQELKEKTARATAELKSDAKAVANGAREGWSRDKPLNLNTATKEQLTTLPGISAPVANRIIAGRPYGEPQELVARRLLSQGEYDKISDRLTARN
jgi:hypothetical protein